MASTSSKSTAHPTAVALGHLNRLRAAAGLVAFQPNPLLSRSARNHAAYLGANLPDGHSEVRGRPGYTGATAKERMAAVGYAWAPTGENIADGFADPARAVDWLMTAIYHRLGFLSFDFDEVGMGTGHTPTGHPVHVFNMGSGGSPLAEFIRRPDPNALAKGPGTYILVGPAKLKVKREAFEVLENAGRLRNPRVVVWPPRDARDVWVTFSGETPPPLPGVALSGYPISVHFNPGRVTSVQVLDFRLFEQAAGNAASPSPPREVTPTRLLTAGTDPNRHLTVCDFALFPLARLEWDRTYSVQARFQVDGQPEEIAWSFHTLALDLPLYEVTDGGSEFPILPGVAYAFRIAPTRRQPVLGVVGSSAPPKVDVQIDRVDQNTLKIRAAGPLCARIRVDAGETRFGLRLASADATSGPIDPAQAYAACPEYSADAKIRGTGETVRVRPGATVRVYVVPTAGAQQPGMLQFRYQGKVTPQVELEDENTAQVSLPDAFSGEIRLTLSGGRSFKVVADPQAPER